MKLFFKQKKKYLQANFYASILPVFNSFILILKKKEPKIEKLLDKSKSVDMFFWAIF